MRQKIEILDSYDIPSYAASALENDDYSGIDSEQDIEDIKGFITKISGMCPQGYLLEWDRDELETPSFSRKPAFGLPTSCVRLRVYKINN